MLEEIQLTKVDIPVLEHRDKIYNKGGYKHASVKDKTFDCSNHIVHSEVFEATKENIKIFKEMKVLSKKLMPIREKLFKLYQGLR